MNMSETPEKKKARLRYDNVFKTAWTDEFHFIKHSRKGNKSTFCELCRTATECTILRPSEKKKKKSWFYHTIFKVLTTQILYPKCSRMHHFACVLLSLKKKTPPLPLLVSRGLACMYTPKLCRGIVIYIFIF